MIHLHGIDVHASKNIKKRNVKEKIIHPRENFA